MQKLEKFNVSEIRNAFPILDFEINGNKLVYLDSAATSQKPINVIEGVKNFYENSNANIHRGIYHLSESADMTYAYSKKYVAELINCTPDEIVYTKNATEAINLLAYSLGEGLEEGDEIILSIAEHHSNLVPWQQLAKKKGLKLWFVGLNDDFSLDLEDLKGLISERTKIVSVTHLSNVLGVVNPIKEIASIAHSVGAKLIVDATQSIPRMKVDVKELDCDFLVWTGHKMYGPTGIGGLYARKELLDKLPPFITGGGSISSVTLEETKFAEGASKFEAGTPPIAQCAGLTQSIRFINEIGLENIEAHENELMRYAIDKLSSIEGVSIVGPISNRIGVLSFNVKNVHSHDVAQIFNDFNIAIRPGHHCAQPLLNSLGLKDCCRISFGVYNTKEEIDKAVEAINKVKEVFQ